MASLLVEKRDIDFILYEQFDILELTKKDKFSYFSKDEFDMTIEQALKFAENELAPINQEGDREGCRFDKGKVHVPKAYHEAYRKYLENGWNAIGIPVDGKGPIESSENRMVEIVAPGIIKRQPVKEPLQTGLKAIDSMSTWTGKGVSWLLVVLILALTYDTSMRYLFSKPTVWSFDVSYMLGGSIMLLGMAWVTTRREQVRVDVLYAKYSPKVKMIVDAVLNTCLFLPVYFMLLQRAIPRAIYAYTNKEFSEVGFWRPLLWPYRSMLVIALLLWVLATIVWIVRDLHKLRTGEDL